MSEQVSVSMSWQHPLLVRKKTDTRNPKFKNQVDLASQGGAYIVYALQMDGNVKDENNKINVCAHNHCSQKLRHQIAFVFTDSLFLFVF